MKTHVVKTTPDTTLAEAVDLMDIYQVNSLPVIDSEGQLCGLISEQDILGKIYANRPADPGSDRAATPFQIEDLSRTAASIPVADVMQRSVVSVQEGADIASVIRLFFVNDIARVPVISDDGRVVGTLNRIDIFQALFEDQLQENTQ